MEHQRAVSIEVARKRARTGSELETLICRTGFAVIAMWAIRFYGTGHSCTGSFACMWSR
jgi:hypothetical protein